MYYCNILFYGFLFFCRCAAGLAHLGMAKYKAAAKNFLQVSIDHCDFPEVRNRFVHWSAVI